MYFFKKLLFILPVLLFLISAPCNAWVIKDKILLLLAALTAAMLQYFLIRFCLQKTKKGKSKAAKDEHNAHSGMFPALGLYLTPAVILFMFWQFYYLGDRCAVSLYQKQVSKNFDAYPRVKVWLKKDAAEELKEKATEWEKGCYKLLLRTKEHLYLFYPDTTNPTEIIPQGRYQGSQSAAGV